MWLLACLLGLAVSACAADSSGDDGWVDPGTDSGGNAGGRDATVDVPDGPDAPVDRPDGADAGRDSSEEPTDREPDQGDVYVHHFPVPNEALQPVAQFFADSMALEGVAEWLTGNFAFPKDWFLTTGQCNMVNALWRPTESQVIMCHELYIDAAQRFAQGYPELSREEVLNAATNTWYFVLFHEIGHALVDLWSLPITGGEEDAVDRFATVLLIEAGRAETALWASFWFGLQGAEGFSPSELAGQHGLDMQRAYNILCLVYGSSPEDYATIGELPELSQRLRRCPGEFEQARDAWSRLSEPWAL